MHVLSMLPYIIYTFIIILPTSIYLNCVTYMMTHSQKALQDQAFHFGMHEYIQYEQQIETYSFTSSSGSQCWKSTIPFIK